MGNDRFVLGLDLDGVCADYVVPFRRHVAAALSVPESSLPDPSDWSYTKAWPVIRDLEHYFELHKNAVRDGLFRDVPPIAGCREALWELSNDGVYIRVITHRLLGSRMHRMEAGDTVEWLDAQDIPYRDICFVGDKFEVGADVYIDDAPHNVEQLRDAGNTVIVFDQPYNRNVSGLRALNWPQARVMVRDLMNRKSAS